MHTPKYKYTEEQLRNDLFQILMSKFKPELFNFPSGFVPFTTLEKIVIRNLARNGRVDLHMANGSVLRMR